MQRLKKLEPVSVDNRRSLTEFGDGLWRCAKYVEVKTDCVIGGHLHKKKNEFFFLVEGEIEELIIGDEIHKNVKAPMTIDVPWGVFHSFKIKAGSKLIGLCSQKFDKTDDYVS